MSFQVGEILKVKWNAKDVKPELRGRNCTIVEMTGHVEPFHYVVEIDQKEYVFRGDELQTVYEHDMELLDVWKRL